MGRIFLTDAPRGNEEDLADHLGGWGGILPNTGLRAAVGIAVKDEIKQMIADIVGHPSAPRKKDHAECMAAGRDDFKRAFNKVYEGFWGNTKGQCDHMADVVFAFVRECWRDRYRDEDPGTYLDSLCEKSPPTEQEIEDAWQVDIESNTEGFETFYRGDARTRTGRDAFSSAWQKSPEDITKAMKR